MPGKEEQLRQLVGDGVVAVIRLQSAEQLVAVAQAVREGGVRAIEFTMTTPDALETIKRAKKTMPDDVLLGAGTVLDSETARAAILAGADFIVGPSLKPEVTETCRRYSKICVSGAFTPTEILTAWECGADVVKVFPASIGGPGYFRDLAGPFPQIRLLPTGGVNLDTVGAFIKAGAVAVGVGGALVSPKHVSEGRFDLVVEAARQFAAAVAVARAH